MVVSSQSGVGNLKFTKAFVEILKNFSTINPQMHFVEGFEQSVISAAGSVFASTKSDVEVETAFSIFSLPKLLSILSLYDNPEVVVSDRFLKISTEGKTNVCNYQLTKPEFIKFEKNPAKYAKMTNDVSFGLKYEDYSSTMKLANILKSDYITFRGNGTKIYLEVVNANENGDSAATLIGETEAVFKIVVPRELLNLIDADYAVGVSKKGAISFKSDRISYYFAYNKDKSSC